MADAKQCRPRRDLLAKAMRQVFKERIQDLGTGEADSANPSDPTSESVPSMRTIDELE